MFCNVGFTERVTLGFAGDSCKMFNDSKNKFGNIEQINISSRGENETIYLNPRLGNLTIESTGSNGNQGRRGKDGRDEYRNKKATIGENGGDGGNVNIHLPKSFGRFIDKLHLKNHGGKGGSGGYGGIGGLIDDEDSTGSFLGDIIGTLIQRSPRMNDGSSGKPGIDGRNGLLEFHYY